ncbi:MAG: hypothetical protein PWQ23_548 [Thermoanaerobacter sp.]|jgi:hypothetical protein|nr:hypothetical protein [Thermoanaerobacter sp.]
MAIEIIKRRVESEKEKISNENSDIQSDGRLVIRYIPRNAHDSEKLIVFGALETYELIRFIAKLDRLHERLDRTV